MDLLGAEGRFKKVEESFQNALREVSSRRDSREDQSGPFADAVTDAASAVHEMLRTLGCEGDQLSKLAEAAVSRGLLLPQDKKLVDWLDAERVRKGDVHGAGSASRGDAWQAIHIAGALILRLNRALDAREPSARIRRLASDNWHLIPGASIEDTASAFLVASAPLLEEERNAGNNALVAKSSSPFGIHGARPGPDSPPTMTQCIPERSSASRGPRSGSSERDFTIADDRRRSSMRDVYRWLSTLTPIQMLEVHLISRSMSC